MLKLCGFCAAFIFLRLSSLPAMAACTVTNTFVAGTNIQSSQVNQNFTDVSNCAGVTSVAGTANQITASPSTGAVTVSLPSAISLPGTITVINSDLKLLGSSTGATSISSANASATNYTATLPAATDTIVELAETQTLTNKTISGSGAVSLTGNGLFSGYGRFGSTSAPTNTTAGDLTIGRLAVGNSAMTAGSQIAGFTGNITATSGVTEMFRVVPAIVPSAATTAGYRALAVEPIGNEMTGNGSSGSSPIAVLCDRGFSSVTFWMFSSHRYIALA